MYDLLFRHALLIDGTGAPAVQGDLAVLGDHIAAVGQLPGAEAEVEMDLSGKALAPGFIDVHVHSELEMLAGRHTAGVQMGVTTELICPDGMSFAPLPPPRLREYRRYLRALYGDDDAGWAGGSFAEYLAQFPGRIRNNILPQAPHGAIRFAVCGWKADPATDAEIAAMGALVRECMEAGATGLNLGLEYLPAAHADRRELMALARIVAEYGGLYAAHIRSYAEGVREEALAETFAVAAEANIRVHISHFAGTPRIYASAEAAHARGIDITWEAYPYAAGCTMLAYALPPAALQASIDQLLADLRTPALRAAARPALERRFPPGSPAYFGGLTLPQNRWMEGLPLREAAARSGKDFTTFCCDLLAEEELAPLLILPWPESAEENEARLRHTLTHPLHMVGTDGIYVGGRAHPRAWGSYPRLLGRYVREHQWLSLEDAVRRMTGFPAARFGLRDRGLLRPGMAADLVVFDPQTVSDRGAYEDPRQAPVGIEQVYVNGVPVVRDGALTGDRPGRVLRMQR